MTRKSILLPEGEATELEVQIGNYEIVMEVFDLDKLFFAALDASNDDSTDLYDELASRINKKYNVSINRGQAFLLWSQADDLIKELKKSVVIESKPSSSTTPSKRKRKKT